VADRLPGHAVLGELVDQGAPENGIEEPIELADEGLVRRRGPGATPEEGEDFDRAQKVAAVGYVSWAARSSGRGDAPGPM
jgi:hypothetical protein